MHTKTTFTEQKCKDLARELYATLRLESKVDETGDVRPMVARRKQVYNSPKLMKQYEALCRYGGRWGLCLWIDMFAWMYETRDKDNVLEGFRTIPFVLWPIQRDAALKMYDRIMKGGKDIVGDKSRDMGLTWLGLTVFCWFWWAKDNVSLGVASRKEELVDKSGNPDTLFWKLDWLIDHLPEAIRPNVERTHMHLGNKQTGSVIDGESTNTNIGRGGRRMAMLLDEFAAVENQLQVLTATGQNTPCRIFVSTPIGSGDFDEHGNLRGNAFAALRFSGKTEVITLPWWEDPRKRTNLRWIDENGVQKLTSDAREEAKARCGSRIEIAQEWDIEYLASGSMFFEQETLVRTRAGRKDPVAIGRMAWRCQTDIQGQAYSVDSARFMEIPGGTMRIWEYPDRAHNYVAFSDIGLGTGASNSTLRVVCVESRSEVAALADANINSVEFARYAVALCQFYKGQLGNCLLGWEANGEGEVFGREIRRLGYGYVLGNKNLSLPWEPVDGKLGWYSNRQAKLDLFADLRSALNREEYTTYDKELVSELERTCYYESGGVGPSELVRESESARSAHGDRVVAAAGCVMLLRSAVEAKESEVDEVAPYSIAWFNQREAREMAQTLKW